MALHRPPSATAALLARAQCGSCTLAQDGAPCPARGPVFGRAWGDGRVVVVGEAPGAGEAALGEPFVGRSGQLLWDVLLREGYRKEHLYLTNALACQPPEGVAALTGPLKACRPRLEGELEALPRIRLILCVGARAAEAITGKKRTMAVLNGHQEWSERWGCRVAFAYHPAYVLRVPEALDDFRLAVRAARTVPAPRPAAAITYAVLDDRADALGWLRDVLAAPPPRMACDLETTGLNEYGDRLLDIGLAYQDDHAWLIPAAVAADPPVHALLVRLFAQRAITWVWHNGKFDVRWLAQAGIPASIDADTLLLHHALEEWAAHDLKTLAFRYLGAAPYADGVDRANMAQVDEDVRRDYAARDCVYTLRLERVLRAELRREPPSREGWPTPERCHDALAVPAANALVRIERRGIRVDGARLAELTADYARLGAEKRAECARLLGAPPDEFNPGSPPQTLRALTALGYPMGTSTDEAALHALQRWERAAHRPPSPLLDAIIEYRSLTHTKATYLDGTTLRLARAPADGRLRGSFLQHRTVTGRLSSRNPNLQNIPAHSVIKSLFVPSEGRVLVYADYNRLEVGVAAWYSGDPALTRDFAAEDFHWETAKRVWRGVIDRMDRALAADDLADLERVCEGVTFLRDFAARQRRPAERTELTATLYEWMKSRLRRQAKYMNFGALFGEGAVGLADVERGMGVPVAEAQAHLDTWKRMYPDVAAFMEDNIEHARRDRWVESASGRRRRFPYPARMSGDWRTEAQNAPIQAFASDINLTALTRLELERLTPTGRGAPLLAVHDSILCEVDEGWVDEGCALIRETMETVIVAPEIRFTVGLKTGATWEECE